MQGWELLANLQDCLHGLVHRQSGLRKPNHFVWVLDLGVSDVSIAINELNQIWRLACGALNFFMTFVADQENVVALFFKALHLAVDLGHKWAGGIDRLLVSSLCCLHNSWRDPVCREDHDAALWRFINLVHKDRSATL